MVLVSKLLLLMKSSILSFVKATLLSASAWALCTSALQAQTAWNGTSAIWDSASSWSAGVPDLDDDVTFSGSGSSVFLTSGSALADSISISGADYSFNFTNKSFLIDGVNSSSYAIEVSGANDQIFRNVDLFLVNTIGSNTIRTSGTGNLTFQSTVSLDSSAELIFDVFDALSDILVEGNVTSGNGVRVIGDGEVFFAGTVNENITLGNTSNANANLFLSNDADTTYTKIFASSGSGTLNITKQGIGTFTVTNNNTYTGTFTIDAGTFSIGNGGSTGAWSGNIVNNASGTLIFNRSSDSTYSGTISGTGSIIKRGSGDLTLSGSVADAGATIEVEAGSIIADADFSDASIVNESLVTFNASGDYGGDMSGTGSVRISGADVVFSGSNSYTGLTTIETGSTLDVDPDNLNGDVVVTGTGTLDFNAGGDFNNSISGTGNLRMSGIAATLNLNAANTYTGTTTIEQGTLLVGSDNALPSGSDVSVASGATLNFSSFTNTVESISAANGSTVSLNGANVTSNNGFSFAGNAALTGSGNVDSTFTSASSGDGVITASGGALTLGSGSRSNTLTAFTGTLAVGSQTVNVNSSDSISTLAADITLSGGTLTGNKSFNVTSAGSFTGNGTVGVHTTVDGATSINGGSGLHFAGGLTGDADLSGSIQVSGTYTPFDSGSSGGIAVQSLNLAGATLDLALTTSLNYDPDYTSPTFASGSLFSNTGTVDISGATIAVSGTTSFGSWKLFADNGQVVGSFSTVTLPNDDWSFDSSSLTITHVPEPSTYAAIFGVIVLGLVIYRRKKLK